MPPSTGVSASSIHRILCSSEGLWEDIGPSTTTMSSSQADSDIVHSTDNIDFYNNIIIMKVDNLLVGWPAYKIKFMPKKPGPMVSTK